MEVEIGVEERGRKHRGTALGMVPHQLNHRNSLQGQRVDSQVAC